MKTHAGKENGSKWLFKSKFYVWKSSRMEFAEKKSYLMKKRFWNPYLRCIRSRKEENEALGGVEDCGRKWIRRFASVWQAKLSRESELSAADALRVSAIRGSGHVWPRKLKRPPLPFGVRRRIWNIWRRWNVGRTEFRMWDIRRRWNVGEQNFGCEISREGGTLAGQNPGCEISGEGRTLARQNSSHSKSSWNCCLTETGYLKKRD